MARAHNPRLTRAQRDALPSRVFGLPKERKYPMPDVAHAIDAKARAKEELEDGNLSIREYRQIIRKADKLIQRHIDRAIPEAEVEDYEEWATPEDLSFYRGGRFLNLFEPEVKVVSNPRRRRRKLV